MNINRDITYRLYTKRENFIKKNYQNFEKKLIKSKKYKNI